MAQPVQQVALRAPGFEGLNTELSPINGDPEFALVADNVVVDQTGRLIARKAFANFTDMPGATLIDSTGDFSDGRGLEAPSAAIVVSDSNSLGGHTGFGFGDDKTSGALWTSDHDMFIHLDQVTGFVENASPLSTTISIDIRLDPESRFPCENLPIDMASDENDQSTWPPTAYMGTYEILQNGVVLESWSHTDITWREQQWFEAVPPYVKYAFTQSKKGSPTFTITTSDFVNPIVIRWKPDPAWIPYHPSFDMHEDEANIRVSNFRMIGATMGLGYEFIKLGRDVLGYDPVVGQQDQRPIMIYRYSDILQYPPQDTRMVPVGMKKERAVTRQLPELSGDIHYGTATIINGALEDIPVPTSHANESLMTGTFANFSAEDLTTGNDRMLLFSKGQQFLRLEDDDSWTVVDANWTDVAGNQYPIDGDIAICAYGRVWVTGVGGDYHQIHYSALLDETSWYLETVPDPDNPKEAFNDAGIIDVREYWPVDGDSIVNIHAHNGFLLVFGRNSILIYANADSGSPAGILNQADSGVFLQDTISNVGLVRRDAICNIGTDVLFVDDSGVRSLGRVIQEKSNPLQEPSMNIRRELQQVIQTEVLEAPSHSAIKLSYLPSESLAVLLFASLKIAYVFHLNMPSKTGGMKVTRWTDCFWNDALELKQGQQDMVYMAGKPTKGLLKYEGYMQGDGFGQPQPYIMRYESMALALGQSPMQTTIPKSIHYVCMGEFIPGQANALWGFSDRFINSREFQIDVDGGSEYNVNEFTDDGSEGLAGYYPDGGPYYKGYKINTTGSGELFRVGFEVKVQGGRYALQEIDINSAIGRLTA